MPRSQAPPTPGWLADPRSYSSASDDRSGQLAQPPKKLKWTIAYNQTYFEKVLIRIKSYFYKNDIRYTVRSPDLTGEELQACLPCPPCRPRWECRQSGPVSGCWPRWALSPGGLWTRGRTAAAAAAAAWPFYTGCRPSPWEGHKITFKDVFGQHGTMFS